MNFLLISAFICLQLAGKVWTDDKLKIICYWANWHMNGNGTNKHTPEDIDPTLCTHIHYAFHTIDTKNNVIVDTAGDQPALYKRLSALKQKNPDLKLIFSVGGWGTANAEFSKVVNSPDLRKTFINKTIDYLHKYNFDGLDLDWEYPVCWMGDCDKGPKSDKVNFGVFAKEARAEFDKHTPRLLLSAAVVSGADLGDQSYDYKPLGEALDYINVMTYDETGVWENVTDHHSRYQVGMDDLKYYASKGIPKNKLIMGVPFYGHALNLADKTKHGLGAPITGAGKIPGGEGSYTGICDLVKNHNWTKEQGDNGHDPIAYHDTTWVSYDDPYAAYDKSKWTKDNGFGGIIVWEISEDDFKMKCCSVTYPMLRAINHGLYGTGATDLAPEYYGCEHK